MRTELRARADRLGKMARRATPGPLLVRGGVYLAGFVALGAGWPTDFVLGKGLLVVAVLPLLPALFPRGILPTIMILAGGLGWLLATTAYEQPVTYLRLMVVTAALYLVHTLAALAAVLPYDAIVAAGVLGRWLLRAGLVLALTAGLGLIVVVVTGVVGTGGYLIASLAGLGTLVGLITYLASLGRRRPNG